MHLQLVHKLNLNQINTFFGLEPFNSIVLTLEVPIIIDRFYFLD